MASMNLDDQIRRYFGTSNLAAVPPEALNAGIEHMKVDLGLTKDRGQRFAQLEPQRRAIRLKLVRVEATSLIHG